MWVAQEGAAADVPEPETLAFILESMRDNGSEDDEDSDAEESQATPPAQGSLDFAKLPHSFMDRR